MFTVEPTAKFPGAAAPLHRETPQPGALERMPKWLICVPLAVQWLCLGIRYGSLTLPSAANPAITAGGLIGEGKLEYFDGMGPHAQAATARHCSLRVDGPEAEAQVAAALEKASIGFPLIAKPDLGLCGYGVRRVDDLRELGEYLAHFPRGETVVLQEYLRQEGEAGIFYARDPRDDRGRLLGLALREFPRVKGDGVRTVAQLIAADPRGHRVVGSCKHRPVVDLDRVPALGETVRLSTVGSTRVGGLYLDGSSLITPALMAAIDRIARDMPEFHFGRFDVRFDNKAALAAGTGFKIMEINGAGSEAIEAWDPGVDLVRAFRTIFAKQRLLFSIAAARRAAGTRPVGLLGLIRLHRRQLRLNASYPASN